MADDLRDKFSSDDEYDEFKKLYNDYKNKRGQFDVRDAEKLIIEFQELLYNSFVVGNEKYIKIPEKFTKVKNMPMYMFYLKTFPNADTITHILN